MRLKEFKTPQYEVWEVRIAYADSGERDPKGIYLTTFDNREEADEYVALGNDWAERSIPSTHKLAVYQS